MKKILLLSMVAICIAGCASPQIDTSQRLDYQLANMRGATLKSVLDDFGPFFDVEAGATGYRIILYRLTAKSSPMVFVPFVNFLAAGNGHTVQRCELLFSSEDLLADEPSCALVEGFSTMWTMPVNEGMTGTGGYRSNDAYNRVGELLAKKGLFFNQEEWKFQNAANNYFLKYSK